MSPLDPNYMKELQIANAVVKPTCTCVTLVSSSARRLAFTRILRRVFQLPRGGGRTIYEGAPSFGRRRRYGRQQSPERFFCLSAHAPSLPLRHHHFYQLIAHWHTNGQQELAIGP